MNQTILLYRSGSVYANEAAAWAALDAATHKNGQPIVAFYTLSSTVSGHHGSSTIGAIFAIGIGDGVGQYKACTSHDDMLIVAQSLNAHITQFNQMFEYDANHNAIKAKLDFYTTDGKSISAGGIGSGSSASLGALYQLVDVMANSSNTGVEGAVEGSVLAYDATAGKWKAIAQSEILPDMSGYYTKDETDSAINTAKSELQGKIDAIPSYSMAKLSASDIAGLSDGSNVREAYRLKKGDANADDTVIKIYKDSALQNVVLQDQKLVFTYLKADGTTATIEVDVSKFLTEQEFGNGLSVSSDGKVSIKIDSTSQSNLTVGLNGLKLSGVVDNSRKVSAGGGLTGGGTLSSDVTISHAESNVTINNSEFVSAVTKDTYGHIASATTKKFSSVITKKADASLITNEYGVSVADNNVSGVQLSVVIDTIDGGTF